MSVNSIRVNGKSYDVNFTFDDLEKKVNGSKNIGELRFGKDGKLHRVNNHSFFTGWNTHVTTGAENEQARMLILELINDNWRGDLEGYQTDQRQAVQKLLLGDDVRFDPISRDEVRVIIDMIKKGLSGSQITDSVMLVRCIKANAVNAAAFQQRMKSMELDISKVIKGWNLSDTAQTRSVNFANWAEKSRALKMDNVLRRVQESVGYSKDSIERMRLNRWFTETLVQTLQAEGVDIPERLLKKPLVKGGQPTGEMIPRSGPAVDREILSCAVNAVKSGRVGEADLVSLIKAALRERLLQQIDQQLLMGGSVITHRFNADVKSAMNEVVSSVALVQKFLAETEDPSYVRVAPELRFQMLTNCGFERVISHQSEVQGEQTVYRQITTRAVDGSGEARTEDRPWNPTVVTTTGPDGEEGEFTTYQMEKAFLQKYVGAVKTRLAEEFDALFEGGNTLGALARGRARFEKRADLFTSSGISVFARTESDNVLAHDVNVLRDAMKQFASYYAGGNAPKNQISFDEDFLKDFRLLEGPADNLSPEDMLKRLNVARQDNEKLKMLTTGSSKFFNGLGFGFPKELIENRYSNMTFHCFVRSINRDELKDNPLDSERVIRPVVKDLCELVRNSKRYGQKALDKIALRLIDLYNAKNTDLMRNLNSDGLVLTTLEEGVKTKEEIREVPETEKISSWRDNKKQDADEAALLMNGVAEMTTEKVSSWGYRREEKKWMAEKKDQLMNGVAKLVVGSGEVNKIRSMMLMLVNAMGYEYKIPLEEDADNPRSTHVLTRGGVQVKVDEN